MKLTRRNFLLSGAFGAAVLGISRLPKIFSENKIPGAIIGASSSLGHKLRSNNFPEISQEIKRDLVIVGGGISGLAAAYKLQKEGHKNFLILDIEKQAGGNSISGKNDVSAYPWAAHYVPLLCKESKDVIRFFEEVGIITGYDAKGLPVYNEYYVCNDPDERLFIYGKWQEGLVPSIGATDQDHEEYRRFFKFTESLKNQKGSDNKRLFAIPLDESSQDEKWLQLDKITMQQWMKNEGYNSQLLHWYVDYCCRDDYGTTHSDTSAWAGLHYFSARNGKAANVDESSVVTWPEGNGWLVNKLLEPVRENVVNSAVAYNVTDHVSHVSVDYFDAKTASSIRIKAKTAIIATPRFIAQKLVNSKNYSLSAQNFSYAPWVVANITLNKMPQGEGNRLSWDNVVYDSKMLGYVVATHQIPQMNPVKTVITYYWPLSHLEPQKARVEAYSRSYEQWQKIFLTELMEIHPELKNEVKNIDIWLWGHAMIRPTPGFIWGDERRVAVKQHPPIFTAHSDMSGISIFEEAFTRGTCAAELAMNYIEKF